MLAVMGADAVNPRVFLDPNVLDPTGGTAIDWYVPSPDGRRVAVSLSRGGSEDGDLHVFEVDTGRQIGEVIPHVQYPTAGGDAAWTEDAAGLWYTHFPGAERPEADRHFYQTVWFHRLGTAVSADRQVFGDGLPRVAEIQMDYSTLARALLITVANGDGGQFAHYVLERGGALHQVTQFDDDVEYAAFGPDRGLYLVSERDAPKRRILKLAAGDYTLSPRPGAGARKRRRHRDRIHRRGSDRVCRPGDGGPLPRRRTIEAAAVRSRWPAARRRRRCRRSRRWTRWRRSKAISFTASRPT